MFFRSIALIGFAAGIISCSNPPEFKGAKAQRTTVEATVSSITSGSIRAEQVAELAFGSVGRVKKLNVALGDKVTSGTVIAELENQDLLSAVSIAKSELARKESLHTAHAISNEELDRGRDAYQIASAAIEKSIIRAPFDGTIVELNLEVGQLSQITAVIPKPLIRIVDSKPRFVRAEIDEVDLSKVHIGLSAHIKVPAVRHDPFLGRVRKVVSFISSVREQDRTSEIELSVEPEGLTLPVGGSADVEVLIDSRKDVLAIPTKAILGRGAERYVYVAQNGRATKHKVTLGLRNTDRAEILEGLTQGDFVLFPSENTEIVEGMRISTKDVSWLS